MNNPHDTFFKETMTRRENAVSFFREYLPESVAAITDWRTLRIVKETYVTPELKERFSDIVYDIRIRGTKTFICFLFEHQSSPDGLMPLRFYHYMGGVWELHLKQHPGESRLPGIIPVLFYHGKEKWNISTRFQDMVAGSELIPEYVPKFEYILRDMSVFSDADIRGNIMIRLFLSVMRRIFHPDFGKYFDRMLPLFAELSYKETGMEYLETVLRYIYEVRDDMDPVKTEKKLIQVIDEDRKEHIMTVAERLRKEGEIRGEMRGEIRGRIEAYKELATGGLLSKDIADQKIAELEQKLKEMTGQSRSDTEH